MRRTFTPNSELNSEVDLNASYLENAILVLGPAQLFIPYYKNLLFRIFSIGAADISCCCRSMEVQIVGNRVGVP